MELKGKGAGVSGGILLTGIRGSAPSTLPRAQFARGIKKYAERFADATASGEYTYTFKQPTSRC